MCVCFSSAHKVDCLKLEIKFNYTDFTLTHKHADLNYLHHFDLLVNILFIKDGAFEIVFQGVNLIVQVWVSSQRHVS